MNKGQQVGCSLMSGGCLITIAGIGFLLLALLFAMAGSV